jgi:Tfp pilus assembly protein PilF
MKAVIHMVLAKDSTFRYAVAALCLLAAICTGCSRDPNVRKQKYLESGQRYFDKGQYRKRRFSSERHPGRCRFADAHYKLGSGCHESSSNGQTAYQELSKTIEIQPDQYAAHLDMANLLILGRQYS